jgi:hypothetical protein
MKNIHILPTDKPSRLIYNDANQLCYHSNKSFKNDRKWMHRKKFNIYITSDEEIKEGDWFINFDLLGRLDTIYDPIHKCLKVNNSIITSFEIQVQDEFTILKSFCKKIILTDNQDLIKDGIQAIDDEFLEWFVKNPSCEFVKTDKVDTFKKTNEVYVDEITGGNYYEIIKHNKIILPQEEAKYPIGGYAPGYYGCTCVTCKKEFTGDKRAVQCEPCAIKMTKEEPKQETLEEAAEKFLIRQGCQRMDCDGENCNFFEDVQPKDLIEFAKWQAERMYSEEEVENIITKLMHEVHTGDVCYGNNVIDFKISPRKWFEQFKKK